MFVRVYSEKSKSYYKSIVYGILYKGAVSSYIVLNPIKNCFEISDKVDIIEKENLDFVCWNNEDLLKINKWLKQSNKPIIKYDLCGFLDVCKNIQFIEDLIENFEVSTLKYDIKIRKVSSDNWMYIINDNDVKMFIDIFDNFHDSNLIKLSYERLEECDSNAILTFYNDLYGTFELLFEKVQSLNLKNEEFYIESGFLKIEEDEKILLKTFDCNKNKNLEIESLNLKWRKIYE